MFISLKKLSYIFNSYEMALIIMVKNLYFEKAAFKDMKYYELMNDRLSLFTLCEPERSPHILVRYLLGYIDRLLSLNDLICFTIQVHK